MRKTNTPVENPSLVIMAAGMGSRFGGLKQITPVGPSGEMIIDYSIYDALSAGFETIVFVIKREIEQAFKEQIGNRIAKYADVKYVYQELDNLPQGYSVPQGRTKPWGTGHAVLSCQGTLTGPFAVINADDYYGRECYGLMYDFLTTTPADNRLHFAMAGYILENTLTENGYVSRGVCAVDKDGMLEDIVERVQIELRDGQAMFTEDGGSSWTRLPLDSIVSMNCWAFPKGTLDHFEALFSGFLSSDINPVKSEFYLPFAVDSLVKANTADVRVLKTADRWFGMTYTEDKDIVIKAIHSLVEKGIYPEKLWRK